MELVGIVSLVLMLSGTQFNFISCAGNSIKTVEIRCYCGSITNFNDCVLGDASISSLKLNASRPTMLYIHGWIENVDTSQTVSRIVNSFLQLNEHNVCALNYKDLAAEFYTDVVAKVPELGRRVALALQNLIEDGVNPDQIHLIGFSIGAHVCGLIGKALTDIGYTIGRISGLDPAGPIYCGSTTDNHALKSSDAHFVDVIHTDGGVFGCILPLGDADFYPNGGKRPQPQCTYDLVKLITTFFSVLDPCSHVAAAFYYADTVIASPASPKHIATNRANKKLTASMGYRCPTSAKGSYDLATN